LLNKRHKAQNSLNRLEEVMNSVEYKEDRLPVGWTTSNYPITAVDMMTGLSSHVRNNDLGHLLWTYAKAKNSKYGLHKWQPIIRRVINTLEKDEYWDQLDSGMWGIGREVRTSSLATCISGLLALKVEEGWEVDNLIDRGFESLNKLLPRESVSREYDAAQLFVCSIFTEWMVDKEYEDHAKSMLQSIEDNLVSSHYLIRFNKDPYYRTGMNYAEWPLLLSTLILAKEKLNSLYNINYYRDIHKEIAKSNFPQSLISYKKVPSPNSPCSWTKAMYEIVEGKVYQHGNS